MIRIAHLINEYQAAARLSLRYLRQGRLSPPIDMELQVWGQSREDWRAFRTSPRP